MSYTAAINEMRHRLSKFSDIEAVRVLLADESWNNLAADNNRLRLKLRAIAETESSLQKYPDELYEVVFAALVFFAKQWPLNHPDEEHEGKYISPISLDSITKPVYTSTGWSFEDIEIRSLLATSSVCPQTKLIYLARDLKYMAARMAQTPITPEQRRERYVQAATGGLISLYVFLSIFTSLVRAAIISSMVYPPVFVLALVFAAGVASILAGCALFILSQSQGPTAADLNAIDQAEPFLRILRGESNDEVAPAPGQSFNSSAQIMSSLSSSSGLSYAPQPEVAATDSLEEYLLDEEVADVSITIAPATESIVPSPRP